MTFNGIVSAISNSDFKNILNNVPDEYTALDYISFYQVKYTKKSIIGNNKSSEASGYLLISNSGLLIICLVITFIKIRDIRLVQAESKMFKSIVKVTTNDMYYIFRVEKKEIDEIEKLISKLRTFS